MSKKSWLLVLVSVLALSVILVSFLWYRLRSESLTTEAQPGCKGQLVAGTVRGKDCSVRILVFSKTGAFRHASIPDGIAALRKLAAEKAVTADFSEDASLFTDANLARYNAVVFLLTSGEILNDEQQAAFERYIRAGGGYAGVHSATDTEYKWAWYGRLVGAYFRNHPHTQLATVDVIDHHHSSTSMLPDRWTRTDEWYNFATNPRDSVHVLMTVDEKTYQGGNMGAFHPIAWYHQYDGGRAWYTALGHTSESYKEPLFLQHLWGGIMYAAGVAV